MATDCRGEELPRAVRPEDWEAELEGPGDGQGDRVPVFKWSFSVFRFSIVRCKQSYKSSLLQFEIQKKTSGKILHIKKLSQTHTNLHVVHGLLQLLQLVGGAQSLQADVCQFAFLLPQLCTQLCYNLIIPRLTPFRESGDNEIMGKLYKIPSQEHSKGERSDSKRTDVQIIQSSVTIYFHICMYKTMKCDLYSDSNTVVI